MPMTPEAISHSLRSAVTGDPLSSLLQGTFADPETGELLRVETNSLVIEDSLDGVEGELVAGLGFGRKLAIISDPNTYSVLGARVEAALAGQHEIQSLVLPNEPQADDAMAQRLVAAASTADAFIAVGSGTINDLTKYASAIAGRPYAVFGTAPSMNGYVSLTASISVHGHKKTLPAQAPKGAFFDLAVLAAAPLRTIRAGLGDSICRATAQADWLLSHLLLGTTYRALPFALLEADEAHLLERAADLLQGDREAVRILVRTLVLSGLGTAIVGSSEPASQAEHLVSHYIDMLAPPARPHVFHGEQVGVTTLSVARLQHIMLDHPPTLRADTVTEAEVCSRYANELAGPVWTECSSKRLDSVRADALNEVIATKWGDIHERISAVMLPVGRMQSVLAAAGAPTIPEEIFLDRHFYESALLHSREIRNRFTMLDLAATSGRLQSLLSSM